MTKKYKLLNTSANEDGTFDMLLKHTDSDEKIALTKCYVKSIEDPTFTPIEDMSSSIHMSVSFNYDKIKDYPYPYPSKEETNNDKTGEDNAEH